MIAGGVTAYGRSEPVQAVVIGSGFGGAVAALRLAQAGFHVVVLERGRRWTVSASADTFCTYDRPDGRAAWLSEQTVDPMQAQPVPIERYTGVLEGRSEEGITIWAGAGVGGGSLVNHGGAYQPAREHFQRVFRGALDYDQMDSVYYPRARAALRAETLPGDIVESPSGGKARAFLSLAAAAGLPASLSAAILDWDIVRAELRGERSPAAIVGASWYGINSGAKLSLDRTYLAEAEATGRVEILPLHVAVEVAERPDGTFAVNGHRIDTNGAVVGSLGLIARYVFLAAGSIGTTELLVRAQATGALPRLNQHVGRYWAANGDAVGIMADLPPSGAPSGLPVGAMLQDHHNPLGPVLMGDSPMFNAPDGLTLALGMALPPADQPYAATGAFRYDPQTNRARLLWPRDDSCRQQTRAAIKATWQRLADTGRSADREPRLQVLDDAATAHPLGGAVLGQACDLDGRVRGYARLMVVDGSLIPGSAGVANPMLTVTALAERVLDRFLAAPDALATEAAWPGAVA